MGNGKKKARGSKKNCNSDHYFACLPRGPGAREHSICNNQARHRRFAIAHYGLCGKPAFVGRCSRSKTLQANDLERQPAPPPAMFSCFLRKRPITATCPQVMPALRVWCNGSARRQVAQSSSDNPSLLRMLIRSRTLITPSPLTSVRPGEPRRELRTAMRSSTLTVPSPLTSSAGPS